MYHSKDYQVIERIFKHHGFRITGPKFKAAVIEVLAYFMDKCPVKGIINYWRDHE